MILVIIRNHLNGYRNQSHKITLYCTTMFLLQLNNIQTSQYPANTTRNNVCTSHPRLSKTFININLTITWTMGVTQHCNWLSCYHKILRYPFNSSHPEKSAPSSQWNRKYADSACATNNLQEDQTFTHNNHFLWVNHRETPANHSRSSCVLNTGKTENPSKIYMKT